MTATSWTVENKTKSIFYTMRSLSARTGIPNFAADPQANTCSVTVENSNETTFQLDIGDQIRLRGYQGGAAQVLVFWVTAWFYNDEPGSMVNSTITIVGEDNLARLGRVRIVSKVLPTADTLVQAATAITTYGAPTSASSGTNNTISDTQTFTGSLGDLARQAVRSTYGYVSTQRSDTSTSLALAGQVVFAGTGNLISASTLTIGRNQSATQIGYQTITRNKFFDLFANTVVVAPYSGASSTGTNAASVTSYGTYALDFQTSLVASSGTQVQSLANYTANVYSDLNLQNFDISWTDVSQNATANQEFVTYYLQDIRYKYVVYYRQPGDTVDRSIDMVNIGLSITANPSATTYAMTLVPFSVYNEFILNNSSYGVLDSSRLGR
jgi:hypothetical protein